MVCPKCGNDCGEFKFCPMCGESLYQQKKPQFPKPPVGVCKGIGCSMQIEDKGVRFIKKSWLDGKTERFIPYEDIVWVQYIPDTFRTIGLLSVRSKRDQELPFPSSLSNGISDSTSIAYYYDIEGKFRCAHAFLKQCAQIANNAEER